MKLGAPSLLRTEAFINGKWLSAEKRFAVNNPACAEKIADVSDCSAQDAQLAIEAAHTAFPLWRAQTAKERATVLRRLFDLIIANQEDLAQILTAEQGKPLTESRGEIAYGASFFEWFAEEGKRVYGDIMPTFAAGKRILVMKEPVGVVGAITPWNFPNAMITRKAAPALAAGCTFVVKPPAETPLSALALAELAQRAGVPAGVFNVVPSTQSSDVGKQLTQHPLVRKFSFTGSTPVGKALMAQCATTVKKVSLELGGNAPFIVFDDADLDAAVEGALISKYRNMGQTCVCTNRIFVHANVANEFNAKLTARVQALTVGDGAKDGVTQGPMITQKAVEKIERLVGEASAKGARILTGGKRHPLGKTFFEPTVLADVTQDMAITKEEIFGPVAAIMNFTDEAAVIRDANNTPYGLAAYFYTRDIGRVMRVAEALEYGIVGINEGIISTEIAPFGGMKESGTGREGSKYGMENYLEVKYVLVGGLAK